MKQQTLREAINEHLRANAFVADPDNPGFVDRFLEHTKAAEWGAAWQRNHVWKDPRKDKIEDGDYLTVIYEGDGKVTAEIATWKNGEYQGAFCMLVFAGKANIGKVAKISDLLPTSFDDILEANKDVLQRLKKGETK